MCHGQGTKTEFSTTDWYSTLKWLFDISLEEANQSQKQIIHGLSARSDLTFLTQRTYQYIFLYH